MDKLISVVMPSYNVGAYMEECLKSVMHQTYRNLEIIVVDAGSTDGTRDVIKAMKDSDSRINLINSDKKSYGYQVNLGIEKSRGEYISIIETDDVVEVDMMETLLFLMEENNIDYVSGEAEFFSAISSEYNYAMPIQVFSEEEFEGITMLDNKGKEYHIKSIVPKNTPELMIRDYYLWNKLYRSDFAKQLKLHETPKAAYQDIGFLFQVFTSARGAIYTDKLVYHYRKDNMGASGYNLKAFQFLYIEYEYVNRIMQSQLQLTNIEEWSIYKSRKWFRQFITRVIELSWLDVKSGTYITDARDCLNRIISDGEKNNFIERESDKYKEMFYRGSEDIEGLFMEERNVSKAAQRCLSDIINWCKDAKVVVFGAGSYGRLCLALLLKHGVNVVAICDNHISDSDIYGVSIVSVEQCIKKYKDVKYVISSNRYAREMNEQLRDNGIVEENIWNQEILLFSLQIQICRS